SSSTGTRSRLPRWISRTCPRMARHARARSPTTSRCASSSSTTPPVTWWWVDSTCCGDLRRSCRSFPAGISPSSPSSTSKRERGGLTNRPFFYGLQAQAVWTAPARLYLHACLQRAGGRCVRAIAGRNGFLLPDVQHPGHRGADRECGFHRACAQHLREEVSRRAHRLHAPVLHRRRPAVRVSRLRRAHALGPADLRRH